MPNSLIVYKDKTLWMGDSFLEIIIYYLVPLIKNSLCNATILESHKEWLLNYHDDMEYYLQGLSAGGIDFELEDIAADNYKLTFFKNILNEVKVILDSKGTELSIKELNLIEDMKLGEKNYWEEPVKIEKIISFIEKLYSMLESESV